MLWELLGLLGPQLQQSPPTFASFAAWAKSGPSSSQGAAPLKQVTIPWPNNLSMTCGDSSGGPQWTDIELSLGPRHKRQAEQRLNAPSSSLPPPSNSETLLQQKKPHSDQVPHHLPPADKSSMAFQRADPNPFRPLGMRVENIPNRPMMVRAVAGRRPAQRNNNLAIATITPLPGNPLHFPTVEEILREFLEGHMIILIKDVQLCHLGQAFVHFEFEHDRDRMVIDSPHPYQDVHISFVHHNQG